MKKLRIAALTAAAGMLLSYLAVCLFIYYQKPVSPQDIMFDVRAGEQDVQIRLWHNYYDGKEYLFLPSFCGGDASCLINAGHSQSDEWDGKRLGIWGYVERMEDGEHTLRVRGTAYTVVVMRSAKVPALFLTTESGSLSYIEEEKGNGERGLYRMIGEDGTVEAEGQVLDLKSRGNSTFLEDKKPYQMTLAEAADLLGTGEQDKYILLANRQDQSLIRDRILYDLAADMGLAYSPASMFVDLYVNEEYRGSYQVSEKVETGHGRIPIDTDTERDETGFLITLEYADGDRLAEAGHYFTTDNGQNVVIKRPKDPTPGQTAYISDAFQEIEDGIRAGMLDEDKIDVTSFARKYLVEEIGKNLDAMYTSQYFYQDAGEGAEGKLYAGPVWDYDKTLGNPLIERTRPVNYQEPRGIFAATRQESASWWYDLYQIPAFREKVIGEYRDTAVPAIEEMLDGKIDGYRDEIWESAYMDYMRWDPFEDFKYGEDLEFAEEYQAQIDDIKEFLRLRMEFLNDIWLEGRLCHQIICDPGEGVMYVTEIDAIEGRTLNEPRDPKREGWRFAHWVREDTGEVYDFTEVYDGVPFTLKAVYVKEEQDGE